MNMEVKGHKENRNQNLDGGTNWNAGKWLERRANERQSMIEKTNEEQWRRKAEEEEKEEKEERLYINSGNRKDRSVRKPNEGKQISRENAEIRR